MSAKENLFVYPVGAKVDGRVLTEPTILHAKRFSDQNGDQHGPEIFTEWTRAMRNAIGILDVIEDDVPANHQPGLPVDIAEPGVLHRTYPDAYLDTAAIAARRRAEVLAQISALEAQQTPRRIREATLTDGGKTWLENFDNQIAALRAQLV